MKNTIFLLLLFIYLPSNINAADLNGAIIDLPPWGYINNKNEIDGIHKNILDALSERTGLKITYKLKPLARFVNEVKTNETDFGMLIMREKFRVSVHEIGYIQDLSQYLIYAKGLSKERMDRPQSVALIRGELTIPDEKLISIGIDQTEIEIHKISYYRQLFEMINRSRVDTGVFTEGALKQFLKESKLKKSDFGDINLIHEQKVSLFMPTKSKGYTEEKARTIEKALKELLEDGTIDRINNKNYNM